MSVPVAGVVLAGGKSSRMGRDKALLELNGEALIALALRKLRAVCAESSIAGGRVELGGFGRIIPDVAPECGPLAGIVSALEESAYEWNLFLAVDMPFVPDVVLRELIAASGGAEMILLAKTEGVVQPLCGVYSRRALPILRKELAAGLRKVKDAVAATDSVGYVEFAELSWFRNLNTPDDFQVATTYSIPLDR